MNQSRRSLEACTECRRRKVRCVRLQAKHDCVNCKMGHKACVIPSNAKQRLRRHLLLARLDARDIASALEIRDISSFTGKSSDSSPQQISSEPDTNLSQCPFSSPETPTGVTTSGERAILYSSILNLPALDPRDIEHLSHQGCFSIPNQHALEHFFKEYFCHIHPLLPIIDEAMFCRMCRASSAEELVLSGDLPLLVLFGMLFTSSSFVSNDVLRGLGFSTTHQAKLVFYKRTNLLYDYRCEPSPIAMSQAALLLSHFYFAAPPPNLNNLAPMWLGRAIHHAKDAGAHRYNSPLLTEVSSIHENLPVRLELKRLWWCCIIRDRIMPLASRQNIQITRSNFDFDKNPPFEAVDLSEEILSSYVFEASTKIYLAEILSKLVKLCVILTDILSLVPSPHGRCNTETMRMEQAECIRRCHVSLDRWHKYVVTAHSRNLDPDDGWAEPSDPYRIFFTSLLKVYYHSSKLTLCHKEMLLMGLGNPSNIVRTSPRGSAGREQVQQAASQLMECLMRLGQSDLSQWLPLSVVGCAMLPLTLEIIDLKLSKRGCSLSDDRKQNLAASVLGSNRFITLLEIMQMCRHRFMGIEWGLNCIRNVSVLFDDLLLAKLADSQIFRSLKSWTDILHQDPDFYLHLSSLLDQSVVSGKYPVLAGLTRGSQGGQNYGVSSTVVPYSPGLPESLSLSDISILSHIGDFGAV